MAIDYSSPDWMIAEQHDCGVHALCGDECLVAGQTMAWHYHDFSGPLVCGCDDWSISGWD